MPNKMPFIRFARTTGLLIVGAAACSSSGRSVRPDDMSAEAHRQEATRAMHEATLESKAATAQPNLATSPNGNPEGYYAPVNSTAGDADSRAERLNLHAREHLAAAAALEAFEDGECKNIQPATRAACPLLGPAVAVDNIVQGVRVRFSNQANVGGLVAQMRCHPAYARTRGFDGVSSCALYLRGVEIVTELDGRTVDLVSRDAKVVAAIQARTREEAILTTGGGR